MVTSNITAPQNKADLKPVTVNRYGTLDELIKIHREDIGVGKVVPMLPFVFFRIGSVNSPPDKWYFALLNRDQLRSSEEVIENYRNGGDVEVLPKEVLDFTLSEMLGRHLFPTQDVMADYSVSYDAALDVVYGRDADKPTIKSNHEGKRILYSLQDNPFGGNQVELSTRVKDCLSYITIDDKNESSVHYGAITVDMTYATAGKGGR